MISHWEKETVFARADYLIVGAGITGLNAAIRLKSLEPGSSVVVVDRSVRGDGASYRNAGVACMGSPTEIMSDIEIYGDEICWETVRMRWEGLQALIRRVGASSLDLVWCGGQEIFPKEDRINYEQALDQVPLMNSQFHCITGMRDHFFPVGDGTYRNLFGTIGIRSEGRLHPGRMMTSLDSLARQLGVRIFGGFEVSRIEENPGHVELHTPSGLVLRAGIIGLATNGFSRRLDPKLPVRPARNQVYLTRVLPLGSWDKCLHFHKGYVYSRRVGDRLLIGGGRHLDLEGETTDMHGLTDTIRDYLQAFVERHWGMSCSFEDAWSGTLGLGEEKRPFIQQLSPRQFAGVRLGGMGVAIGTLVGDSLANRMLGQ